jgi:hypothetical protein
MKTIHLFGLFTGLNLILLGGAAFLFFKSDSPSSPVSAASIGSEWKDLNPDDLPSYISNLRKSGISEPTVRKIATAKVAAQYDTQRQAIVASPATTQVARSQKQALLDRLDGEQKSQIDALVNPKSRQPQPPPAFQNSSASGGYASSAASGSGYPTAGAGSARSSSGQSAQAVDASDPAAALLLPAALAPDSPEIPITTEAQVAQWEKLQSDFVEAIGGENPNFTDPNTINTWNLAQQDSDDLFRAKFGKEAFLIQNMNAYRQGVGR